jgi:signal transduction histidine kinase
MSWVTIIWSMCAAACLTLGAVHLLVWQQGRDAWGHLFFSLSAVAAAGVAACELLILRADTVERYGAMLWLAQWPVWALVVSVVWFVQFYLRAGRRWLAWVVVGARTLTLVLNFFATPNINFSAITGLQHFSFLGETIDIAEGTVSLWGNVGKLSSLVLFVFLVDAAVAVWRRGERNRALYLGGSTILFIALGAVHAALVERGIIESPYLVSFAYLGIVVAMAYESSRDVLRAAELGRELQASELQTAHLSRVTTLGEISGSLAHELNQPLAAILANAEAGARDLGRETPDTDELRAILTDIRKDSVRAADIVKSIRVFLRRQGFDRQPRDLAQLAAEAVWLIRADAMSRSVAIAIEIPPDLPPVAVDRVQLQQVLLNLLVNAMDAMRTCAPTERRIIIRASCADRRTVQLGVVDAGAGIPPEDLERVFASFHTTKPNGLGLGLSICRSIIEAHGGSIELRNNDDRGATAYVSLPVYAGGTA